MGFCLRQEETRKLIEALKNDKIDPEKMAEMSSKERRDFFKEIVGEENAADVNRLFETKLLLKNQQKAMVAWAETTLGERHPAKKDILSRIQRMDKILDAPDRQKFLEDLASHRLGTAVTFDEAKTISELAGKATEMKEKLDAGTLPDRLDYGRAQVALNNYVNELKLNAEKMKFSDLQEQPGRTLVQAALKPIIKAPGFFMSIKASMDDSAIFRQGWKPFWTHNQAWRQNSLKTFVDMYNTFGGKAVMDEVNADIISRPTYDLMKKAKLDVGATEEAYPEGIVEKIPVAGRAYKASENAYSGFLRKTRADVFDQYIDIAKKNDVELTDQELVNIGRLVNSLTGRGYLGMWEKAGKAVNTIFFSPKNLKSHIDFLLLHPALGGATLTEFATGENFGSSFVARQARKNILKAVAGMALVMAIGKAVKPDMVELDPRSADFGKFKIGNTRIDISGGYSSLLTLAARIASLSTKSSTTGKITKINETDETGQPKGFGKTALDLLEDFTENKMSPVAQAVMDMARGHTKGGQPATLTGEALDLVTPLPGNTASELLQDPNAAPFIAGMLADFFGAATNTYGGTKEMEYDLRRAAAEGDKKKYNDLKSRLGQATSDVEQKMQEAKAGGDGENYIKLRQQFLDTFGGSKEINKAMKEARKARNPDEFNRLKEILVKVKKLEDEKKREKDLRDRDKEIQEKKQK